MCNVCENCGEPLSGFSEEEIEQDEELAWSCACFNDECEDDGFCGLCI